jgi:hypothetical protein
MKNLLTLIAPKFDNQLLEQFDKELTNIFNGNQTDFDAFFLKKLVDYKLSVLFTDNISLGDLVFKLRQLVINNHIEIDMIADEMDENDISDDMLKSVGRIFKKQGWLVCDFDRNPRKYVLSIVPIEGKHELKKVVEKLDLYIQFFE